MRLQLILNCTISLFFWFATTPAEAIPFLPSRLPSSTTLAIRWDIRGGANQRYDDDADDYDRPRRPSKRQLPLKEARSTRRPPRDGGDSRRPGPPPNQRYPPDPRRYPPPRRRRRQPSALDTAASLAKSTLDVSSAAAWTTLKGSGKAAYYLVSPKHVTRREVWGLWRLDQQIVSGRGGEEGESCAANVELTPRGDVVVRFGSNETFAPTPYVFTERTWPRSCIVTFEARAFQGPHDSEPVLMRYKGFFRRKVANRNVIKIVGHVYAVRKTGWRRGDGRKIGTFVARRRVMKKQNVRQDDEFDDDDEFEDDFDDEDDDFDVEDEEEDDWDDDEDNDEEFDDEYDEEEGFD